MVSDEIKERVLDMWPDYSAREISAALDGLSKYAIMRIVYAARENNDPRATVRPIRGSMVTHEIKETILDMWPTHSSGEIAAVVKLSKSVITKVVTTARKEGDPRASHRPMRGGKPKIDCDDDMVRMYEQDRMSTFAIAAKLGCSSDSVRRVLWKKSSVYRAYRESTRRKREEIDERQSAKQAEYDELMSRIPHDTRDTTGKFFNDPLPGRSALDQIRNTVKTPRKQDPLLPRLSFLESERR